jgi:Flp pilus assembly protein TadD
MEDVLTSLAEAEALRRQGQSAAATAKLRQAASRWPNDARPYLHLAELLLASGMTADAVIVARRAVRREPDRLEARKTLAAALLADGRPATACEALAAAVALAPHDAELRSRLGEARLADGRPVDALAAMLRAHRLDPDNPDIALAAARMMIPLHRRSEAIALLHRFIARGKASPAVQAEIARLSRDGQPEGLARLRALEREDPPSLRVALREAEARVARGTDPPDERIAACFALSRHWFEQDEPEAAFACLHRGHRLLRLFEPFDRRRHALLGAAMVRHFPAARFAPGALAPNRDPAPVFIVGMPRSGTTLAEQILAAHAQVFGAGERTALGELATRLGGRRRDPDWPEHIATLPPDALARPAGAYLAELHALAPESRLIVDKMPGNFQWLGLAARLLPGAKIIHCVRDPRDIGLSIYSRRFDAPHPYAHDLADLGWYIAWQQRLMAHWREVLPNPILTLRLHDWIHDFDRTLSRVLGFLDLPPDPACARFYELEREVRTASREQVRQPVNDEGMGRWRRYERQLLPLIEALRAEGALPGG